MKKIILILMVILMFFLIDVAFLQNKILQSQDDD